ncbi:MAG TPA: glycosyl hydrolase [Phycisphaerae bacterium]|nr:glycosyl hydrolase [Phycisphaerae bacterium]
MTKLAKAGTRLAEFHVAGAIIALSFAIIASAAAPNAREREEVYPFAMCSNGNILRNREYAEKLLDAGAIMARTDFPFTAVRKEPGDDPDKWDWTVLEQARAIKQAYPRLEWLGLLGYGALWAEDPIYKDRPGEKWTAPQRGINVRPVDDPKNLYGHWVYESVRRYGDIIKYWESWNEPDLGPAFFKGTPVEFFAYQRTFYLAAKKADPECKVLFAGICYPSSEGYLKVHGLKPPTPHPPELCFFEEYLKECLKDPEAQKNNYYFDIMNTHTYSRATDTYNYVAIQRKLMQDYLKQGDKPVWITEMGITDKGGMFGCSEDEYCDYMLQSFAWGSLAGVSRFFHFQLDNSNGHGLYDGMLGNPKPALKTYRDVLVKEFAGTKFSAQLHGSKGAEFLEGKSPFTGGGQDGYDLFEFRGPGKDRRVLMVFADTKAPVTIKVPAEKKEATLIDRHNNRKKIQAGNGSYTVELSGATNIGGWPTHEELRSLGNPEHLIGGATVVIVEE